MNDWPPYGFDTGLPADFQGSRDPGNDNDEELDEFGDPIFDEGDDFNLEQDDE